MPTIEQQIKNRIEVVRFLREEMPRNRFDISRFHEIYDLKEEVPNLKNPECGTIGCVGGWLPAIFPDQCEFQMLGTSRRSAYVKLKENPNLHYWTQVLGAMFGVEEATAYLLFNSAYPDPGDEEAFRDRDPAPNFPVRHSSTPAQVADRIEDYFKRNPLILVNETASA